jgi:hypothetical protein
MYDLLGDRTILEQIKTVGSLKYAVEQMGDGSWCDNVKDEVEVTRGGTNYVIREGGLW